MSSGVGGPCLQGLEEWHVSPTVQLCYIAALHTRRRVPFGSRGGRARTGKGLERGLPEGTLVLRAASPGSLDLS